MQAAKLWPKKPVFFSVVDSHISYEDNILREAETNADIDNSVVIAPELTIAGILGKQCFSAVHKGEYAKHSDFSNVNYTDHDIRLRADFDHSNRLTSRFDAQYQDKHEDLGDLNTVFVNLNEFNHDIKSPLASDAKSQPVFCRCAKKDFIFLST